jgi:hypothetical protein
MQTWAVKRLSEYVNSQRNIQWSSENQHVLEDFFFLCNNHKVEVLEKKYISALSILTLLFREITGKKNVG